MKPTANAGQDFRIENNRLTFLQGSGTDPNNLHLTYNWSFILKPQGSIASLDDNTIPNPKFTPDKPGAYELMLKVNNGTEDSDPSFVKVTSFSTETITRLLNLNTWLKSAELTGRISPGVVYQHKNTHPKFKYPVVTAILGFFEQGTTEATLLDTIDEFYFKYGTINTTDSLSCLSYLQYAKHLLVKRVIGNGSLNASTDGFNPLRIDTRAEYDGLSNFLDSSHYIRAIAQTPGRYGNNITVALFTNKELADNVQVNRNYKAKDIVKNIPDLYYCAAIFIKDKLIEQFNIPINRLSNINDYSNYIYIDSNITVDIMGEIDGNLDIYDGNADIFYGGTDIYDGSFLMINGNICLIDGNQTKPLFCVPTFYNDTILRLKGGLVTTPTSLDYEEAREEFENILNYDIDLVIANNTPLMRDDVVNIVPVPNGVSQAVDFVDVYDMKFSTPPKDIMNNIMFIYGQKKVNRIIVPLAGDWCGQRADIMNREGLGISNSKIAVPMKVQNIIHSPKFPEQEFLYSKGINCVLKEHGKVYCNGEQLFRKYT